MSELKGADYNKMEKAQAKKDNATLVANSGRGFRKGDSRTDLFLIDYKFTEKLAFSLNLEKFKKHEIDAFREKRIPVFVSCFTKKNKNIAILEWESLQDLIADFEDQIQFLKDKVKHLNWQLDETSRQ